MGLSAADKDRRRARPRHGGARALRFGRAAPQTAPRVEVAPFGALRQWWLVFALSVLAMLSAIDKQILALLLDPIKGDLRLTDTEVSLLFGLSFAAVHSLVVIPSGWAADRWARRWIAGGAAVSWSVMTIVCGLAASYWQLFAGRMGVGMTEGLLEPSAHSLVRDGVDPARRGRAFAALGLAPLIGTGLAAIAGGVLLEVLSGRGPFVLPVVGEVALWQVVLMLVGAAGVPLGALMLTVREPPRPAPEGPSVAPPGWRETFGRFAVEWRLYLPILLYALGQALIGAAYGAWAPSMLMRVWGLSPLQVGLTLGVGMMLTAPIGALGAGLLIDLAKAAGRPDGLPLVGVAGAVMVGLPASLAPLAPDQGVFWVLFAVHMMSAAIPVAVVGTAVARITPSRLMGKVVSVRILLQGLIAAAFGPTLAALVGDRLFGGDAGGVRTIAYGLSTVAAVSGAISLAACLAFWRAYARRPELEA